MGRIAIVALAVGLGCGRYGFDLTAGDSGAALDTDAPSVADADPSAPDADPSAPDADPSAPDADPSAPDADPPDANQGTPDAAPGSPDADLGSVVASGTYALELPVNYTCAVGLVSIDFTAFFFDEMASLVALSDDTGSPAQPCAMTGPAVSAGQFDVTCTLFGGCDEIYRLVGGFDDDDQWTGTFSVTFSGMCLNCTNQSFPVVATRCLTDCPVPP